MFLSAAADAMRGSSIFPHSGLHSGTNTIIHVTTEATHEVWVPNKTTFAFDTNIPLLMIINISSVAVDALADFLPILPWNLDSKYWTEQRDQQLLSTSFSIRK